MSAESLTVTVDQVADGTAVAAVAGEIDLATVEQVERALAAPAAAGLRVIVDLTGCDFIDSSGLRALVSARSTAAEAGGGIALVVGDPGLLRVLEVAALDQVFEIHETRDAALAAGG